MFATGFVRSEIGVKFNIFEVMWGKARYLFIVLLFVFCACRKTPVPPRIVPAAPAIQYPLLSKMTLVASGKTYTDTYTYDTVGDYKNNPIQLRSEIAGKLVKFQYGTDISFRTTLLEVDEYDINTNQLIDIYHYSGYYTGEPAEPPFMKDVSISDPAGKVFRRFTYVRSDLNGPVQSIVLGTDTITHMTNDENGNITVFDTGTGHPTTYIYDDKHHPLALLPAENEHLQFSVYPAAQTFFNNPLTITVNGATTTYTYQYNQYGYPLSAKVSDGGMVTYEYVGRK